jgi:phospholipid/cholesterol/gamma-HCH transport system substrate-binding protein
MQLKVEHKVGIFIIVTVLLAMAGLIYMAYKKGLFQAETTYTVSSQTGDGLSVGMPLYFSGLKIGKVKDLELSDQGLVMIKISVPDQHGKWIRSDSKFVLEKPLIGSAKLTVTTKSMSGAPLSPQAVAVLMEVNDINDAIQRIQPILDQVASITENVVDITDRLADPQGDMSKILRHSEKLTASLSAKESFLEMALGDQKSVQAIHAALRNSRQITDQINILLKKTEEGIYGKDGVLPLVTRALRELVVNLAKIGATLDNIAKITSDAAGSTKDLKLLRSDIDATVNSLNRLLDELNRKMPFKAEPTIKLP